MIIKKKYFRILITFIILIPMNIFSSNLNNQLIDAILNDDINLVRDLIEKGANVNYDGYDRSNSSVLMIACKTGNTEIIELLIKKGADVNAFNSSQTVLVYTIFNAPPKSKLEIIKLLIKNGVDIDAKYGRGLTALMHASEEGYLGVVKLLIKYGADINIKIYIEGLDNVSAMDFANLAGHEEIFEYFLNIKTRYVNAETGLQMKVSPDINAETIKTIPYKERVLLLEEIGENITISGSLGKWSKIDWYGEIGWVFGGFLTKNEL